VTDNGSTIFEYKVYILESDGLSYSMDSTNCDGADPTIFAQKYCIVPFSTLASAPFILVSGTSV
jgi:hypothetical protein